MEKSNVFLVVGSTFFAWLIVGALVARTTTALPVFTPMVAVVEW